MTQIPAAGTDDDTSYDEGTGDRIRPDAEEAPTSEQGKGKATHHLPADIPPGELLGTVSLAARSRLISVTADATAHTERVP
ncbi:hypothetical protein [Saccharopolyspora sp. NPDC049426]|uniref:hypothetical protein n=1 Tax=Saccharopolyspora sp. NPDC049426 TaxID=3155652 RepID=UPI003415EE03